MLGAPHLLLLHDAPAAGPVCGVTGLFCCDEDTPVSAVFIGDTLDVLWKDATDRLGTPLIGATATWSLTDYQGEEVAGGSMLLVVGSNSDYRGALAAAISAELVEFADYYLELTLDQSGARGFRRIRYQARYRGRN